MEFPKQICFMICKNLLMRGFVAISRNTSIESMVELLAVNDTTGNEAVRAQYLPLLWPVQQSGAAVEPNDVILTNLMMSHCFNRIP